MGKETIFFVINSLYGGGAEHVASRLSKVWHLKYNLYVISLQPQTKNDYQFEGSIISISESRGGITWFGHILSYAKAIDKLSEELKPDVMVSFLQNANLVVLNTRYKCKKIVSVRNFIPRLYKGIKKIVWDLLVKHYYPKADFVVSVSKLLNDEMINIYGLNPNKCRCIYNPYYISKILDYSGESVPEAHKEFMESHVVIANVGSLAVAKGQFHLIRILPALLKQTPNLGLVIVGPDKGLKDKLVSLSEQLGVREHVLFAGFTRNPYCYLKHSVCFVFPSLFEGFPNALVEAMICGLPVIASNCKSGPYEILISQNEKYGYLLDDDLCEWLDYDVPLSKNEEKYIETINHVLANQDVLDKYSRLSTERAKAFSIDNIICQWDDIISKE